MHVAHGGLALRRRAWDISSPRNSGAVDGDAGRRHAGIRALVDLHLRNIQAGGAEVQADLLAQGTQFIARTNDRQPRRAAAALAVARSTPARRRNKSKKRMATSIARTAERLREHARTRRARRPDTMDVRERGRCGRATVLAVYVGEMPGKPWACALVRADAWTGYAATCSTGAADGVLRDPVKQRCRCKIDFRRNRYSRRLLLGWITGAILRGFPLMDNTLVA